MSFLNHRGYKLPFVLAIAIAVGVTFNPFKTKQEGLQANLQDQAEIGPIIATEEVSETIEPQEKTKKLVKLDTSENAQVVAIAQHYQEAFRANPRSITRLIKVRPAIESAHVGFVIEPGREKGHFDKLGLQLGDIITEVNGTEVSNLSAMQAMITSFGTANSLTLTLVRNDAPIRIHYKVDG